MRQVPLKYTHMVVGHFSRLEVTGVVSLDNAEKEALEQVFRLFSGASLQDPRATLSCQANANVDRVLLSVVSTERELEHGVFKVSVLGPYTQIRLNDAVHRVGRS